MSLRAPGARCHESVKRLVSRGRIKAETREKDSNSKRKRTSGGIQAIRLVVNLDKLRRVPSLKQEHLL